MNKIKVLYISHSALMGGAEICLLTLVSSLDRTIIEPVVVLPAEGPLQVELQKIGVRVVFGSADWWIREYRHYALMDLDIPSCVTDLLSIIDIEKPDIIQTNTSVVVSGAIAAQKRGIPHIWHIHEMLGKNPRLGPLVPLPLIYWIVDKFSTRVVAVSNAVRLDLVTGVASDKVVTIHNGIDRTRLERTTSGNLRHDLNLPADAIVVAAIGAIAEEKGHELLVRAAAIARNQGADIHYVVAGAEYEEMMVPLDEQIERLGLEDVVHFIGFKSDVRYVLDAIDFLVLPSITESFSLVTAEAMAVGKPAIVTDCGGPSEIVVNGETGFIVPVGDAEALAEKILLLARDRKLRCELGRRSIEVFNERFQATTYARRFEELYCNVHAKRDVAADTNGTATNGTAVASALMQVYQNVGELHRNVEHGNETLRKCNAALADAQQEMKRREQRYQRLRHSKFYRLSRAVTWPLRKLASGAF